MAASGDAAAVGFVADFDIAVVDGPKLVVDDRIGEVTAPGNDAVTLTGSETAISADLGPLGVQPVAQAGRIETTATSGTKGSDATARLTDAEFSTPGGILAVDAVGSQVKCPVDGPATANVDAPTSVILGDAEVALEADGETVIAFDPGPGPTSLTLTVDKQSTTSGTAAATALVIRLEQRWPDIINVVGTLTLAQTSCEAPAAAVPPAAKSLNPESGPAAGRTDVTLTGSGFVPGETTVTIGNDTLKAADVNVAKDGLSLTFTTPGGSAGDVEVTATTPAGTTGPLRFSYLAVTRTTSGVLRDARTGGPIRNSCVAWRPTSAPDDADNYSTNISTEQGGWSFTSDDPGPFYLSFYVSESGDCSGRVDSDTYLPSWYENQPFSGSEARSARPPRNVTEVAAGTSGIVACLGTDELPSRCAVPDTSLSGRVVGVGPKPINQACIFAFADVGTIGQAITDADGRWSITGLPVDYPLTIGVVPPVDVGQGPCRFEGPPPVPAAGELQPEFYTNTWVDLADPELLADPYQWGVDRGARILTNDTDDINVCLTTDAGDVTPRSSCTPTPAANPTTTNPLPAADPRPATGATLADTGGPDPLLPLIAAALLTAAGVTLRRSRSS